VNYSLSQFEKHLVAVEGLLGSSEKLKEEVRNLDIRNHIAEVFYPVHEDICQGGHEFYNLRGGRGSGKSSFCALELVSQIMKDETGLSNALVLRKWACTLRGSVFSQIQWAIEALSVGSHWRSTLNPMQFVYETGQVIKLTGLDDPQKLKSLKPVRGYFKFLWCEEFNELSGEMELRNLQQSVLRGGDNFCVMRSFNPPISRRNWANEFCDRPDERSLNLLTNYQQLPVAWLGQTFVDEAARLKELNPRAFQHEYLGLPVGNGAEVFEALEVRAITDQEYSQLSKVYSGLDWGFSTDPACFLRVSYDPRSESIWIMDEVYQTHLSNRQLAEKIKEKGWDSLGTKVYNSFYGSESYEERALIIADSASPKDIADMRDHGLKIIPCTKFQGCVEYRIRWLQHRKIIVDPRRTPNTARELQNYQYDIDKRTGEVLSSVPDKDNHSLDALAYSLDRVIYDKRHSA
jgi:PBSX family phage terminase large subunit